MSSLASGNCLCGASRYEFDGTIKFAFECYCRDCQKISGGGHLPQAVVAKEGFHSSGPIRIFHSKSDAGSDLTTAFCSDCGSPLFKTSSRMEESLFICIGSMDEAPKIENLKKVFESSRQPWDGT